MVQNDDAFLRTMTMTMKYLKFLMLLFLAAKSNTGKEFVLPYVADTNMVIGVQTIGTQPVTVTVTYPGHNPAPVTVTSTSAGTIKLPK